MWTTDTHSLLVRTGIVYDDTSSEVRVQDMKRFAGSKSYAESLLSDSEVLAVAPELSRALPLTMFGSYDTLRTIADDPHASQESRLVSRFVLSVRDNSSAMADMYYRERQAS